MQPARDKDYDNLPKRTLIVRMVVAEALLEFSSAKIDHMRATLEKIAEMPHDELGLAGVIAQEELDRP